MPPAAEVWLSFGEAFARGLEIFAYRLQNPSWRNPFCVLFAVCALCFALEALLPKQLDYPLLARRGFKQDLGYLFFIDFALAPLGYIPLHLIGFSVESFFAVTMWSGYLLGFLSHSNVKINWGILNHLLITPDTHFWHHAMNVPHRYGVNFASNLVIWDQLFGCFHLPKDERPELGIRNDDVPAGFAGQQLYPLRAALHPSRAPSFGADAAQPPRATAARAPRRPRFRR